MTPLVLALTALLVGQLLPRARSGRGLSVPVEHWPCVRLFHAQGDVGCRTPRREGVARPLLLVDSERQLGRIEGLSSAGFHAKIGVGEARGAGTTARASDGMTAGDLGGSGEGFIAVMPEAMFNRTTLERMSSTGLLEGVLVLEEAELAEDSRLDRVGFDAEGLYSPDVSTPQGDSTPTAEFDIDASFRWNSQGDGLLMESLDFPVVLVSGGSREIVHERALANGDIGTSGWRYPLHKARMTFYFGGSDTDLNSQACLGWTDIDGERSPQCLPLGGQSSWASVGPPGMPQRETVLAAAGMDSTSLFHNRAPGANSGVSGLVALLAAAESLAAAGRSGEVNFSDLPRQIVFAAFQAEAYGFTGSRRFVKDWREGIDCRNRMEASRSPEGREACLDPLYPSLEFLNLGRPAHVVTVDQVGCLPESTLWVHASPGATEEDTGMLSSASPSGDGGGVSVANATRDELPPTPLTAFVKANSTQSGFVISGYDEAFSCPYYHDHRDTKAKVKATSVAAAAEVLARSTLLLAGGGKAEAEALAVNASLVETLIDCLLEDWTCVFLREYVSGELANIEEMMGIRVPVDSPFPPSLYSGPLEFHNGGGLPTVRHTKDDGSWQLHPSWSGDFDPDHDKIQLVPNLVEMFCRAFLSEQASSAHAGGYGTAECQSSGDCPPGKCPLPGALEGVAREECVRGRCACPSGFHHIALGVGLEREETINQYRVVQDAVEQGAPLWTEVNWRGIGVEVYLDPGNTVENVALGVGAVVTAFAGVASWVMFRSLSKHKLL